MPNWVRHNLTITGPEGERERFVAECFAGDDLDFKKLTPEPESVAVRTDLRRDGDNLELWFETAWGIQSSVYEAIAERFPKLRFEGCITEEFMHFCGDIVIEAGKIDYTENEEAKAEYMKWRMAATNDPAPFGDDVPPF